LLGLDAELDHAAGAEGEDLVDRQLNRGDLRPQHDGDGGDRPSDLGCSGRLELGGLRLLP
jgi:hypothetical protein